MQEGTEVRRSGKARCAGRGRDRAADGGCRDAGGEDCGEAEGL